MATPPLFEDFHTLCTIKKYLPESLMCSRAPFLLIFFISPRFHQIIEIFIRNFYFPYLQRIVRKFPNHFFDINSCNCIPFPAPLIASIFMGHSSTTTTMQRFVEYLRLLNGKKIHINCLILPIDEFGSSTERSPIPRLSPNFSIFTTISAIYRFSMCSEG